MIVRGKGRRFEIHGELLSNKKRGTAQSGAKTAPMRFLSLPSGVANCQSNFNTSLFSASLYMHIPTRKQRICSMT